MFSPLASVISRVTISNDPLFIASEDIERELSRFGRLGYRGRSGPDRPVQTNKGFSPADSTETALQLRTDMDYYSLPTLASSRELGI